MADVSLRPEGRTAKFDRVYLAFCVLFFGYAVLQWRGTIGDGRPWEPARFVGLTGGMLLQAIAFIVRMRSARLFYGLLIASLVALGFGLMLHS